MREEFDSSLLKPLIDTDTRISQVAREEIEFQKTVIEVKGIIPILILSIVCWAYFIYIIISTPYVPLLDISMGIGIIMTIIVLYYWVECENVARLRKIVEGLNEKSGRLKQKNEELLVEVGNLEEKADRKKRTRQKLEFIISIQGMTTRSFLKLVKEKKKLSDDVLTIMKYETLERFFSFVLITSQDNERFSISKKDLPTLIEHLKDIIGLRSLEVEQFKKVPENGTCSISYLIETCFNILEHWEILRKESQRALDKDINQKGIFSTAPKQGKISNEIEKFDVEHKIHKEDTSTIVLPRARVKSATGKVAKFKRLYELSDGKSPIIKPKVFDDNDTEIDEIESNESTEAQSFFKKEFELESDAATDENPTHDVDIDLSNSSASDSDSRIAVEEMPKSGDVTDEIPNFDAILNTVVETDSKSCTDSEQKKKSSTTLYELDDEDRFDVLLEENK